jgi:hypothetical protein
MADIQTLLALTLFALSCAYLYQYQSRRSHVTIEQREENAEDDSDFILKELFHGVNPTVE